MWPHEWPKPARTERVHTEETEAKNHYAGLLSMQADHPPRPCGDHVWDIRFEERDVSESEWVEKTANNAAGKGEG